jgi:hypothetical protein
MAMDEDKPVVGSAAKTDDLSQYDLDEYDDDVKEEGECRRLSTRVDGAHPKFQELVRLATLKD